MDNYVWVSWTLTALAAIAAFVYFRLNRKTKRIEVVEMANQSLLNGRVSHGKLGTVTVLVDGERLQDPRSVVMVVRNAGTEGLDTSKMFKPLTVVSGENDRLVSVRAIVESGGDTEHYGLAIAQGEAELPPMLLNQKDQVTITALVDGRRGDVRVRGQAEGFRIVTQKRADDVSRASRRRAQQNMVAGIIALVTAAVSMWVTFAVSR